MKKLYSFLLFIFFGILSSHAQTLDESFVKPIPYKAAKTAVIKELPDGKILLGGNVGFYKDKKVNNLIRLNADYSLDETFVFNGDPKFEIKDVKFQSNGNIIVLTTNVSGVPDHFNLYQLGLNGEIIVLKDDLISAKAIAVQSDDKILVTGGEIGAYGSTSCYLHRYNSDFSLDETFNNDLAFNASTTEVVVSENGIYVGGVFNTVNGIEKNSLIKLNSDGIIDTTFDVGEGSKGNFFSLTLQEDGKLLIGGNFFSTIENSIVPHMIRLNADGTIDNSFSCQYGSFFSSKVTVKDSYIYINTGINNITSYDYNLIRLNSDGSVDESFSGAKLNETTYDFTLGLVGDKILYNDTETTSNRYGISVCDLTGNLLNSSELQASRYGSFQTGEFFDGKLVVKGDFIKINDVETFGIALLNPDGSFDESFVFPKYFGDIKQFQVIDNSTIFVSTKNKLLKLNNKGEVLKDFNFKTDSQLLAVEKFKVLDNGKILITDNWGLYMLNEEGIQEIIYTLKSDTYFWFTGLTFEIQDNKIISGGIFNELDTTIYPYKMIRFNLDGSVDESFKINGSGPDYSIERMKVLDNGEIIAAGIFSNFNGISVPNQVVKLSKDGEMDLQFNENQKEGKIGNNSYHDFRKIEQLGSVIYITEGDSNVTAINTDGTFVKDFELPVQMDEVSDIIALDETTSISNKAMAKSAVDTDNYIFAIGSSKNTGSDASSFIVKINVGKPSGSLSTNPTPEKLSSDVQLYPVPVSNKLNLSFSDSISPNKIAVYSINGAELYSNKIQSTETTEIDMSKFKSGTYIIKLFSTSGVVTKKIIKK